MPCHVGDLALAGNEAAAIVEPSLGGGDKFIHVCRCGGLHAEHFQQSGLAGDIERLDAKVLLDPLLMLVQRRASLVQRRQASDRQQRRGESFAHVLKEIARNDSKPVQRPTEGPEANEL